MTKADLLVTPYQPEMARDWDAVVLASTAGTVLHSRRFLDYHGHRFRDLSLVGFAAGGALPSMVFPLAADPQDPERAVSHPGSSFGGVVGLAREPRVSRAFLHSAAASLRAQGYRRLLYRTTPSVLLRQPDDGLLALLLRVGQVSQLDLWSVLRLGAALPKRGYWQSELRKGQRRGLHATPALTVQDWTDLHRVISARLGAKYGRALVHSVDELVDLQARLGPQSRGMLIRDTAGTLHAAMWFIDYGTGTLHNQYIGATNAGLVLRAPTFGLSVALEQACAEGFQQFSFGRSTLEDGWSENTDLLRFKSRFGAGIDAQFHIEVSLDQLTETGL